MKIKTGTFGIVQTTESKKETATKKSEGEVGSDSQQMDGVSLSSEGSFIQALRQAAQGQEPLRTELVEQAKLDIANGSLGSKEDFEQAINALLQEL